MRPIKRVKGMRRERGSALLEGAIICAAFFYMLIGIVDFGQFLFIHQTLTERAREAVRYGITTDPTSANFTAYVQNVVLYGQATGGAAPGTAQSTDLGIFNVPRSDVTVSATGVSTDDYRLTVQIKSYKYTIYSPLIAGSYTGPNILAGLPLGPNFCAPTTC